MPRTTAPAALRLVNGRGNGTDSGGRKVPPPPKFRRIAPSPPDWLPDEARAEWDRVAPGLQRLDLTKEEDRASLTAYCMAWYRFVEANRLLIEEGVLGQNSQGRVRHPAVAVAEAASKELRSWAGAFGLTPSDEQKVARKGEGIAEDDPFA